MPQGQPDRPPVIEIGTVTTLEPEAKASVTITENGKDTVTGAKKYLLNLSLPKGAIGNTGGLGQKGDTGPAPILELGQVNTLEPSAPAYATFTENGTDLATGAKKYLLTFSIPKGADGAGNGNVFVEVAGLLASKQYAFKPTQNGSTNGTFVEIELDVATAGKNGLLSSSDKKKLDGLENLSKANIERFLAGNITTHTHDGVSGAPVDVWDGVTISTTLAGSGTKDNPWLIKSCADFLHMNIDGGKYGLDVSSTEGIDDPTIPLFFAKIMTNLDFGGHEYSYPSLTTGDLDDPVVINAMITYMEIDGQGVVIKNMNLRSGFSPFFSMFCCHVHDIYIKECVFSLDVNLAASGLMCSIFAGSTQLSHFNFTYNCSCEAVFKTAGTYSEGNLRPLITLTGVFGVDLINNKAGSYYGNNTIVNEANLNGISLEIQYAPVMAMIYGIGSWEDLAKDIKAYDVTKSVDITGFVVSTIDSDDGAPVYYNSDVATILQDGDGTPTSYIGKTTEQLKSAEFLTLLNGETDTFVADTGINGGYPIFKKEVSDGGGVLFDGYVRQSVFDRTIAELKSLIQAK